MATFRHSTDTSSSDLLAISLGAEGMAGGTLRGVTPARAPTFELEPVSGEAEHFGPYLVYEELGVGGMASVHRAELPGIAGFKKPIALKRMLPHVAADEGSVRAFLEEAKLASQLHHENISGAFDFGSIDDTHFIAMELVPGPTLKQIMIQCHSAAGAIPIPIAVEILIQLLEALDYAHTLADEHGRPLGIIHRDVSPANVIVSGSGIVKLIDFGVAKTEQRTERTQTGVIKGKFGYMAPEYIGGRLDVRADLFGVGVVAHELFSGRRLFGGTNDFEIMNAVRERPIPKPSRDNPRISATLDDIVMTALQRHPDQRWQSARAMQTALANVARELGTGVSHRQIRDWTEWAFTRDPRASIEILQIVESISEPSIEIGGADILDARPLEARTILARPARGSAPHLAVTDAPEAVKYPALRTHPLQRLAPWLVLLLLATLAGLGIWQRYDAPDREAIFDDLTTTGTAP
jgi:serine/threonine protein kinase